MMNMVKKAVDSKLIAVGVLILAVIFFSINLFSGSNPAEDTDLNQDQVATLTDNSWGSILIDNFWLFVIITILAIVAMNWFLKRKGATTALSWTLLSTLVTFIGILAFSTTLFIFMLIPGDIVAYFGTIVIGVLMAMIVLCIVMLVTGWGSRLLWGFLLAGFLLLAFNSPETTANQVAEGTATISKEGLRGMTPNIVPDFIYTSPEEQAAKDKARREEEDHQAKLRGTEAAAYDTETAKNRPLTTDAFTTRTAGKFEPIQIRSGTRIGPIYTYSACKLQWTKKGMGMLKILTRHDPKKEPVEATLNDYDYGIKTTGHESEGPVADLFFEAVQGDIQIELVRFDNGTNLENPCE